MRYRRLFLPMALGSTIGLFWTAIWSGLSLELVASYFAILLFLPSPWLANAFILNMPAWSLFVEIVCNAMHPILIAPAKRLIGPIAVCFAIWVAFAMIDQARWQAGAADILTMLPGSIGCYLLGVYVQRRFGDAPLGKLPALAMLGLIATSAIVWRAPGVAEPLVILIACPLILRSALAMQGSLWAFWIGAWSFPLYATHEPVMRLGRMFNIGLGASALMVLIVSVAVTLAVTKPAKGTR